MENLSQHQSHLRVRNRIAIATLGVGIVLMAVKFWAYSLTGSKAILSDALESIVNVVAAIGMVWVIRYASKPADDDHPYGHGKLEFFSAAFEGGLVAFAGVAIFFDAIRAIVKGHSLYDLNQGLVLIVIAGVANGAMGLVMIAKGKSSHSPALEGGGRHLLTDAWTTVAVIFGLLLVQWTGIVWIDAATAVAVAIFLLATGYQVARKSMGGLMDEEDPEVLRRLGKIFEKIGFPGLIQIHHVKAIRSGLFHHIDAHMVIPEFWDISKAHIQLDEFEKQAIKEYGQGAEFNFHLDPCRRAYCAHCDLQDCAIRQTNFESRWPVRIEDLRSPQEPERFRRS